MTGSQDRILTTHVGSLVRPPELIEFLHKHDEHQPYDEAAFGRCLTEAVEAVVAHQQEVGIDIVNDGEYGRTDSWSRYILERLEGISQRERPPGGLPLASTLGHDAEDFAEFYTEYMSGERLSNASRGHWAATGPIRYAGHAALQRAIDTLKAATKGRGFEGVFMTAVAPASVVVQTIEHYPDEDSYLFALAEALNEEYRAIVDAGFMLQVDDAYLATNYDVMVPPASLEDYRRWAASRIEVLNHALKGIPPEKVRYHVCWGSWNGPHTHDVEIKHIVDIILSAKVGAYSLEMANPRHEHEWRVWEHVKLPDGRKLLPGVISHATNVVEHPELVAERIVRLARLVGRENVIASTDCGFAQGTFVRRVHPSIMWAKLATLAAGGKLASRELWG